MKVESLVNAVNGPVINPPNGKGDTAAARKPVDNTVNQEQDGKERIGVQPESNSKERLNKTLEIANSAFKEVNIGFRYSIDKRINREVVAIINIENGEIIRQYPPEEIINMLARIYDMLGILIDQKI
jgi:flagellar protein FlaG